MDSLDSFPMPACLLNDEGEVLVVNRPFSLLRTGEGFNRDVRTHFRSDHHLERQPMSGYAHAGQVVEMLINDAEYIAHIYPTGNQAVRGFVMLLLAHPKAPEIDPSMQSQMLKYSVDCIKLVRHDGTLEYMNRAGCVALGVSEFEQRFGMPWLDLLPEDVREAGREKLPIALAGVPSTFPGRSIGPTGEITYWDNLLTPVNDPVTKERKVICVSRNVTQEVQAKMRLKELSETDELTGLFNRRCFGALFGEMLSRSCTDAPVLLCLVDFDHFKHVNDHEGHHVGDQLLRTVAARWKDGLPRHALISRLGGDEFAIACGLMQSSEGRQREILEREIMTASSLPLEINGRQVHFGLSVGSILLPAQAQDAHEALVRADDALRQAKRLGKGQVFRYNHSGELDENGQLRASGCPIADDLSRGKGID